MGGQARFPWSPTVVPVVVISEVLSSSHDVTLCNALSVKLQEDFERELLGRMKVWRSTEPHVRRRRHPGAGGACRMMIWGKLCRLSKTTFRVWVFVVSIVSLLPKHIPTK